MTKSFFYYIFIYLLFGPKLFGFYENFNWNNYLSNNKAPAHFYSNKHYKMWKEVVEKNKDQSEVKKVRAVERFFDRNFGFISDIKQHSKKDYWQTLQETLFYEKGDCEDFAIAKYITLRILGVSESSLKILYLKPYPSNISNLHPAPHMVLKYSNQDLEFILDNRPQRPSRFYRESYHFLFEFNEKSLWKYQTPDKLEKIGPSFEIRHFRDLLARIQLEIINTP